MNAMDIYNKLPVFAQNLACTLEGVRVKNRKFGRRQKRELPAFLERNGWSYQEKCKYRDLQLQKMVEHCYLHVPYYRDLFDQLGIDYKSIRKLEDLSVLPILTKDVIQENMDKFMADNVNKADLMFMRTSGTTGSCFQFYYTKSAYYVQWADKQRHDYNLGLNGKEWAAYFAGRPIVPIKNRKPPFYRVNYAMKEVMFSAFHLSPENFPNYIAGLEKFQPKFWHGYPSSILALAQYILDTGKHLTFTPQVIQLTSENVSDTALNKMEEAFGVRPVQGYGQTEQVATFWEFNDGRMFVMEDLSAVEFIPLDETGICKVVGTTLTNYAMPFLRYDTRDLVTYREVPEGREILSIIGRVEDNIKLKNGGTLRRVRAIFKDQKNIAEAQVIQKSYEMVEFHIVKGTHYTEADEAMLNKYIKEFLAARIGYEIVYVDSIPKTKNGKRKFIISEL